MGLYRIIVETTIPEMVSKVIEAGSLRQAIKVAEGESWIPNGHDGWEEFDQPRSRCGVREDLCEEVLSVRSQG